jgi:hypothetical protein
MPDQFAPDAGQRIGPTGRVTYEFDGHVHADGLDLDAGTNNTPPDDRRVRWLNTLGQRVASLFGVELTSGGTGRSLYASVDRGAADLGQAILQATRGDVVDAAVSAVSSFEDGPTIMLNAGAQFRALLNGNGTSDYAQVIGGPIRIQLAWDFAGHLAVYINGAYVGALTPT